MKVTLHQATQKGSGVTTKSMECEYFQYYIAGARQGTGDGLSCASAGPTADVGLIRNVPEVGELHHHYERRAA
jgi:hypothetical protein